MIFIVLAYLLSITLVTDEILAAIMQVFLKKSILFCH